MDLRDYCAQRSPRDSLDDARKPESHLVLRYTEERPPILWGHFLRSSYRDIPYFYMKGVEGCLGNLYGKDFFEFWVTICDANHKDNHGHIKGQAHGHRPLCIMLNDDFKNTPERNPPNDAESDLHKKLAVHLVKDEIIV
jgi:hypothetical protein